MTTWEIEVEMRVRKTFRVGGPANEEAARASVESCLTSDGLWPHLTHYEHEFGVPRPVEVMIDNNPKIVSIKAVA